MSLKTFCDYKSLQQGLDDWCALNYVTLAIRNCHKIKLHNDKSNEYEVENIVYESLYFVCIHYGQPRVMKSDSLPSSQRTQQAYNAIIKNTTSLQCFI